MNINNSGLLKLIEDELEETRKYMEQLLASKRILMNGHAAQTVQLTVGSIHESNRGLESAAAMAIRGETDAQFVAGVVAASGKTVSTVDAQRMAKKAGRNIVYNSVRTHLSWGCRKGILERVGRGLYRGAPA